MAHRTWDRGHRTQRTFNRYQLAKIFCGEWEFCTEAQIVCISNEVLFQFPFDRPQTQDEHRTRAPTISCINSFPMCMWCASWLTEIRVRYFLPSHLFVLTAPPSILPQLLLLHFGTRCCSCLSLDDDDFASKTIKFHLKIAQKIMTHTHTHTLNLCGQNNLHTAHNLA